MKSFGLPMSKTLSSTVKIHLSRWARMLDAISRNMAKPLLEPRPVKLDATLAEQLTSVNLWVNRTMKYRRDSVARTLQRNRNGRVEVAKWNLRDRWGNQTGGFAGDCDDYALFKRELLIQQYGWPQSSIHPIFVHVPVDGGLGGHLISVVTTDRGDYFLDNRHRTVYGTSCSEAQSLRFLPGKATINSLIV